MKNYEKLRTTLLDVDKLVLDLGNIMQKHAVWNLERTMDLMIFIKKSRSRSSLLFLTSIDGAN